MNEVRELEDIGCRDIKYLGNRVYVGFCDHFAVFVNYENGLMVKYMVGLEDIDPAMKDQPANLGGGLN